MKHAMVYCVLGVLLAASQAFAGQASQSAAMAPLAPGQAFPALALAGPLSAETAAQIGLKPGKERISLDEAKPQALIVVIFSMYCPFCQKEAPRLEELRKLITERGMQGRIALVGLGAGNSAFEVNLFREKFGLGFPLFPDPDFTAYKALGQVGTPFFYVLSRKGAGYVVADAVLGCMDSPQTFLNRAAMAAGVR